MTARWGDHGAGGRRSTPQSTWGDGYVVDTPYFEPVNIDVSPAWLSMISVFHGQPPLDLARPLTWLDLGAASGISAAMVAATNPNVDVWGFDHNPGHVERGRHLAGKAELANCHFEEASFAQLASDESIGPAEADVIVVSGVYSWVSKENQRHIAEIIRRRLRPGGLAYVMYETSTGWAAMVPLAETLRLLTEADGRSPEHAFHDAAAAIGRLADGGAAYFPLPSREAKFMESWADANPHYAAHEYLGSHFGPLMFDEVAETMSEARCTYLGSTAAVDHIAAYWARPSLVEMVTDTNDVVTRELLRDVIGQRALRRDLYRRGLAVTPPMQNEADLRALTLVGLAKEFDEAPVDVLGGGVNLDPAYYEPLIGALRSGPLDVATIMEIHTEWTFADAVSGLAMLVAGGYASPIPTDGQSKLAVEATRRLNELLVWENRTGADHTTMASARLGSGVDIDSVGVLAVGLLWDGSESDPDQIPERVMATLDDQGRTVREDGKLVDDRQQALAITAERVVRAINAEERLGLG